MTLRIERSLENSGTLIRLSGELQFEHLDDMRAEIERSASPVILDLDEVDLVDGDAVCWLNACEAQDVQVVNCPLYIREWMLQELTRSRGHE